MRRNSDITTRFPGLYRQDILDWKRQDQGLSQREVARRANISEHTIRKVFAGKANNRKVWPVANVLNLNWTMVHNLDLQESDFHLAVTGNGKRAAG